MRRFLPILALVSLALWLPASQHCALEQAGVISTSCQFHDEQHASDGKDACGALEQASYKPTGGTLKVQSPTLLVCAHPFTNAAISLPATTDAVALKREPFQWPEVSIATWHFVRRTAPLPGAPSLKIA